jgi:hypothetical protein
MVLKWRLTADRFAFLHKSCVSHRNKYLSMQQLMQSTQAMKPAPPGDS